MIVSELIEHLTSLVEKEPEVGFLPVVSLTKYDKSSEIGPETIWFGHLWDYSATTRFKGVATLEQAEERLQEELEGDDLDVLPSICLIIGDFE